MYKRQSLDWAWARDVCGTFDGRKNKRSNILHLASLASFFSVDIVILKTVKGQLRTDFKLTDSKHSQMVLFHVSPTKLWHYEGVGLLAHHTTNRSSMDERRANATPTEFETGEYVKCIFCKLAFAKQVIRKHSSECPKLLDHGGDPLMAYCATTNWYANDCERYIREEANYTDDTVV